VVGDVDSENRGGEKLIARGADVRVTLPGCGAPFEGSAKAVFEALEATVGGLVVDISGNVVDDAAVLRVVEGSVSCRGPG
jgi:hypothetical protein